MGERCTTAPINAGSVCTSPVHPMISVVAAAIQTSVSGTAILVSHRLQCLSCTSHDLCCGGGHPNLGLWNCYPGQSPATVTPVLPILAQIPGSWRIHLRLLPFQRRLMICIPRCKRFPLLSGNTHYRLQASSGDFLSPDSWESYRLVSSFWNRLGALKLLDLLLLFPFLSS